MPCDPRAATCCASRTPRDSGNENDADGGVAVVVDVGEGVEAVGVRVERSEALPDLWFGGLEGAVSVSEPLFAVVVTEDGARRI